MNFAALPSLQPAIINPLSLEVGADLTGGPGLVSTDKRKTRQAAARRLGTPCRRKFSEGERPPSPRMTIFNSRAASALLSSEMSHARLIQKPRFPSNPHQSRDCRRRHVAPTRHATKAGERLFRARRRLRHESNGFQPRLSETSGLASLDTIHGAPRRRHVAPTRHATKAGERLFRARRRLRQGQPPVNCVPRMNASNSFSSFAS